MLAVVAIIIFLVAYATDAYRPAIVKSAMTEAANLTAGFKAEIAVDFAVHGRLPERITALDFNPSGGKYFSGFEWRDDELVASLQPEFWRRITGGPPPAGQEPLTLSFRIARTPEVGRLLFICGQASPPPGFDAPPVRHTTVPEAYLRFFCRI